jgi:hypothetical protein
MKTQRLAAAPVLFAILLGGCATTQPIPALTQPQMLAIDILVRPPMGFGGRDPAQVYFVRIEGPDGLQQQSIIRSNYVKGSRAYLVNARPGTYAAVASMFLAPGLQQGTYTTYFPQTVVERTRLQVREGEVAFMGAYVLGTTVGLEGADALQNHYKNVIAPGASTGTLSMGLSGSVHYKGTLIEQRNDQASRDAFLLRAKEDLAGSAWAERLR